MENSFSPLLQKIANISLQKQKPRDGDFVKDGITYCGICGKPRNGFRSFPAPTNDNPDATITLKMAFSCDCDKADDEREQAEIQAKKDLEEIEKLRSVSLMDDRMKESRFESFEATKYNSRNLKLCKRYVERFDEMIKNNQGLILWGDVGTGKSFAASCIANALLDKKYPVVMTSFVKIIAARESSIWNTMRRRRRWKEEFTVQEREACTKLFSQAHTWYLVKGVPKSVTMTMKTYELWQKLGNFCGSL